MNLNPPSSSLALSSLRSDLYLATATNSRYLPGALVSLASAILSASGRFNYHLLILGENLSDGEKQRLQAQLERFARARAIEVMVEFIAADGPLFQQLPVWEDRGNSLTFARLLLPKLLLQKHCIYIDSDVLAFRGIEEFWEARTDAVIVACKDQKLKVCGGDKSLRFVMGWKERRQPYFNSGIISMNLEQLREEHLVERLIETTESGIVWKFADQSLLNFLCAGRWLEIDRKNNLILELRDSMRVTGLREPSNLHFASGDKPWLGANSSSSRVLADRLWDAVYQVLAGEDSPALGFAERAVSNEEIEAAQRQIHRYRWRRPARAALYRQSLQMVEEKPSIQLWQALTSRFPAAFSDALLKGI